MRVHVVGSSGTFPTPSNPASGYVIESGRTRVWCEAGPGTFVRLPFAADLIDAVFVSHRHPDHCTDLFSAYHAWTFCPEPRSGIPLYANQDVIDHLAAFAGRGTDNLFDGTFVPNVVESGQTIVVGELEISFVDVSHSVPGIGTKWVGDGRTLFYSGDTGPGDWAADLAGVNTFLSEAALQGERGDDGKIRHLTAFEAGQIARDAGVDELVLTHIPPYMDVSVSVSEAESVFGKPVRLAVPGTRIQV
jgi:ribonuclease BN (tRNA processing enzyme)